ncbi:hypothetical protein BH09MYX1_BH09MYX1_45950 [soil metagenome]
MISRAGRIGVASVLLLAALFLACDEPAKGTKPTATATAAVPEASPADQAKTLAQNRCAMCHGATGKGDGPQAGTLSPKPRDFTAKEWQKSVSDTQIRSAIVKGGGGVGKSVLMPANPDLENEPQVVDALVKIIRGYGP